MCETINYGVQNGVQKLRLKRVGSNVEELSNVNERIHDKIFWDKPSEIISFLNT